MRQMIWTRGAGFPRLDEIPIPCAGPGQITICNARSAISAGTEKMTLDLARMSLLGKARERPDELRKALRKMREEGIFRTLEQVRARLDEPQGLGYSSAGVVLACGEGVREFKPGDRVASNGPHAEVVCVPQHLCARVPDKVPFDQAAYTVLGAIALQGVRLAHVGLGDTALVIGLGLIGQIATALLRAAGSRVLGIDPDPWRCRKALEMGAETAHPGLSPDQVASLTRGLGADAVLVCAATKSSEPIELAAAAVRKKGRIVAVGVVGLDLPRRPLYYKEAEVVVSCSYGPGRYDPEYEERGHDYPAPYVRWTEQRNMQAVLDLMASGKLDLSPLTTHRFRIEDAEKAYALIDEGREPYLGILLEYPEYRPEKALRRIDRRTTPVPPGSTGIGVLGAGIYARSTLLPLLRKIPALHPRILCSAGGLSAAHAGETFDFDSVTTDEEQVYADPDVRAVFILTRHHLHAAQAVKALRAGKHVFAEKPLALTVEELAEIESALSEGGPLLTVGFNRRFSPAAREVRKFFEDVREPLAVSVRFNAGSLPPEHWTQDEEIGGGRLIGEACHGIDLAVFLTGSPVVRVFAESVGGPHAPKITDDRCFITLRHANGSASSIAYLAGGDRAFPKERVEVIGGERVAVIEDFREVLTSRDGKTRRSRSWTRQKGHREELEAFARAISQGGPWPIPWEELRSTSLAAILAVRSLREGVPLEVP